MASAPHRYTAIAMALYTAPQVKNGMMPLQYVL
jgi:hypothetical protein